MRLEAVNFNNYIKAIEVQNEIFPEADGTLNILASLDRDLFIKITGIKYPDDNVKYYLAYYEDKVIGITGLYKGENKKEAWIAWFGILPRLQGNGYGRQLLEETINLAKSSGYDVLRLYTDKNGNAKAIILYEKLGFVGEKYLKEELAYDCVIYSKNLRDKKVALWNNKNLNLSHQSELDQMDKQIITAILNKYKKL